MHRLAVGYVYLLLVFVYCQYSFNIINTTAYVYSCVLSALIAYILLSTLNAIIVVKILHYKYSAKINYIL